MKSNKVENASEHHSLHIKENKKITKNFRVFVGTFQNDQPEFRSILDSLLDGGPLDTLEYRIASPGGYVTECQQLVNVAENKFNGRTTAYIDSHASSAGAILFSSCDKRVIYWNSRIMFHNYSGGYFGEYKKIKDRMDFDKKHIIEFLEIAKPFFSKTEWKKLVNSKEYWFNAKEMLKRNIATHIIIDGVEYSKKQGLKKLKNK
jgi:ATP-dependent protease ClpP protease subunit